LTPAEIRGFGDETVRFVVSSTLRCFRGFEDEFHNPGHWDRAGPRPKGLAKIAAFAFVVLRTFPRGFEDAKFGVSGTIFRGFEDIPFKIYLLNQIDKSHFDPCNYTNT
jgi:hypothetical protein